ncbi:hypothetical protein [Streptomyces sp. NPDC047028]|uniref:hypothetical protein n=1 Tax=Streptomyces sp. NPDC047028 TaxID=3155793 RepID=UPI0033CD33E9
MWVRNGFTLVCLAVGRDAEWREADTAAEEAPLSRSTSPRPLPVGLPAYDTRRDRRGIVMDHLDGYVWLRPPAGGVEWTALPGDVEPEGGEGAAVRARVAEANARSRGEVL